MLFDMYVNVAFPFTLPALTYKVPENALPDIKGRIVKAPIMTGSHFGLVIDIVDKLEGLDKKHIKEIHEVYQRFANDSHISFLKWLSTYYLAPIGAVLKGCFFEHAVQATTKKKHDLKAFDKATISDVNPLDSLKPNLSMLCNAAREKKYQPFLLHAQSISYESKFIMDILRNIASDVRSIAILAPEIWQVERLSPMLREIFGERLCILHSKLTRNKIIEALNKIMTGESDVVLGTRSAILAPIKGLSFIAVTFEHSLSYKGEEGLRYNARDVAVMRGFIEKSCVLLSSAYPSVESVYNAKIGKYNSIIPSIDRSIEKRPKIKIADIKREKKSIISRDILKEAKYITSKGGRVVILVKREGYALLRCEDCDHIYRCERCNVPLVFHKISGITKCHYCGQEEKIPESCKECRGFNIKPFGAGTERIREEIANALKVEALIIEKGHKSRAVGRDSNAASFIIGTAYAARKLGDEKFDAAALLNIDSLLAQPDFRAYERAFQEVMQIAEMVKPEGTLYLQTWNPKNKILRFSKNYDFRSFYEYETTQRKILNYPPFSRIILFNVFTKKDSGKFLHEVQKIILDADLNGLEILGPVEAPSTLKSYKYCIQMLLKSNDRKLIHQKAETLLEKLRRLKGIKINVDVDPLKI